MAEININEIAGSLRESGWLLGREIGSGGGAKIFLCLKISLVDSMKYFMDESRAVMRSVDTENVCLNMFDNLYHSSLPGSLNVGAVKVPKALEEPSERGRLKREIEALESIKHPNLIRLYEVDKEELPRWFIMEYHPKDSLQNQVKLFAGKPLETIKAILGLAECLSLLHSHPTGYVHRDVKPKNIFVDFYGRLVLGDFGIVFPNEDDGDRLTIAGTSEVFSRDWVPDWVRFRKLDNYGPKIDVYMLAKVIYFMVTGGQNVPASQLSNSDFDLKKLFPESDGMGQLYGFLKRCITTQEDDCEFMDGKDLLIGLNDLVRDMGYKPYPQLIFNLFQPHSLSYIPIPVKEDGMGLEEIFETMVFLGKGLSHFRARAKVIRSLDAVRSKVSFKLGPYESEIYTIAAEEWSSDMVLVLEDPNPKGGWCHLSVKAHASLRGASLVAFSIYGH